MYWRVSSPDLGANSSPTATPTPNPTMKYGIPLFCSAILRSSPLNEGWLFACRPASACHQHYTARNSMSRVQFQLNDAPGRTEQAPLIRLRALGVRPQNHRLAL